MKKAPVTALSEHRSRSTPLAVAGDVVQIPHSAIRPSPLNPRKAFDPEALEELAASIASQTLLQNLVVRPGPDGTYELAAGERRWRAVGLLIARGEKPADEPLPVVIRDLSDAALVMLGLAENVQRASMTPLEEGEAFVSYAALAKRGDGATVEIAQLLGKTQRWVQQRIALATKLVPKAKELLAGGEITIEQARALTTGSPDQQNALLDDVDAADDIAEDEDDPFLEEEEFSDHLDEIGAPIQAAAGDPETPLPATPASTVARPARTFQVPDASSIRRRLTETLTPLSFALFPLERYTGEIAGLEDEPLDQRYFVDTGLFQHLQETAIAEKEAELATTHVAVEIERSSYFQRWRYERAREGAPSRAIIHVDDRHRVQILTGCALAEETASLAKDRSEERDSSKALEPCTKALLAEAHRRKTATLQDAIANDAKLALRLACFALLTPASDAPHRIRLDTPGNEDRAQGPLVAKRLEALLPPLPKDFRSPDGDTPRPPYGQIGKHGLRIWEHLASMSGGDVEKLLAALVAAQFGTFSHYDPKLGDPDTVVAFAQALGVDHAKPSPLSDDWLTGYRKPRLVQVARASGALDAPAKELEQMTGKSLREAILASKTTSREYVPAELYFGTATELEQRDKPKPKATAPKGAKGKLKSSKKR